VPLVVWSQGLGLGLGFGLRLDSVPGRLVVVMHARISTNFCCHCTAPTMPLHEVRVARPFALSALTTESIHRGAYTAAAAAAAAAADGSAARDQ